MNVAVAPQLRPAASTIGHSRSAARAAALVTPRRVAVLLAGGLAVIICTTASDYGVAWDDAVQTEYGRRALNYFLSGGQDRACHDWLDLRFYGPLVELPIAAAARIFPGHLIEIRHLVCSLIALLGLPPLLRFGRMLGGARSSRGRQLTSCGMWIGVVAILLLWTMPRFYGHAFLNSKDIPFAVGMAASMASLAELFARGRFRWREVVGCGMLLGLTTAVRPGGWMLLGPYYVALCLYADLCMKRPAGSGDATSSERANTSRQVERKSVRRRSIARQGVMLLTAWVMMVAFWPWAHEAPLSHPLQALRVASKFHVVVPVLFEGQVFASDRLPRDYLAKYLLFTTPPAVLGLAALGTTLIARALASRPRRRRSLALVTLLIWPAVPLLLFSVMRPNAYDGLRHFLFVLPAISLLAAFGFCWMAGQLHAHFGRRTAVTMVVVGFALVIGPQLATLVRLHPYQMTYFNQWAGGMAHVERRFETDYWLTSYKEAMGWIRADAGSQAVRVLVAANEHSQWCAGYFADDQTVLEHTLSAGQSGDLPEGVDYYVATTRGEMAASFPDAATVKTVGRAGATFAVIKRRGR